LGDREIFLPPLPILRQQSRRKLAPHHLEQLARPRQWQVDGCPEPTCPALLAGLEIRSDTPSRRTGV